MDRGRRPDPLRRRAAARPQASGVSSACCHLGHRLGRRDACRTPPPGALGERRGDGGTARIARPTLVVVHGTRIIASRVLESLGCPAVNVHAGITPRYRGVHGGYWALAEGHPEWVGTTVHLVDPGIDTGAILAQATFDVTDEDTIATYPDLHLIHGLAPLGHPGGQGDDRAEARAHAERASLPARASTTTRRSGATSGAVGAMGSAERRIPPRGRSTTIGAAGVAVTSPAPTRGEGSVARGATR